MEQSVERLITREYKVGGMVCAGCVRAVEDAIKQDPDVKSAHVSLIDQSVVVESEGDPFKALQKSVSSAGFSLMKPDRAGAAQLTRELRSLKRRALAASAAAPLVFALNMFAHAWPAGNWIQAGIAAGVLIYSGGPVFVKAFKLIRKGRAAMETLIAAGAGAAFVVSLLTMVAGAESMLFFEAAVFVLAFVLLGKWAETGALRQSRDAAGEFLQSAAKPALRKSVEGWEEVAASAVAPGDVLRALPGERLPADGVLCSPAAELDEQWLTGESAAVFRQKGDPVFAGTLNAGGAFEYRASADASASRLHLMADAVKAAEAARAPAQRLADKIAGMFAWVVLGLAALTLAGWLVAGAGSFVAVQRALSVLVISCPCALGLATPLVVRLALRKTARSGALFKDAGALERLAAADCAIFDKTGTLTTGKPAVADAAETSAAADALPVFRQLAEASSHPVARGVADYMKDKTDLLEIDFSEAEIREHPGLGAEARLNGGVYLLGSKKFLASRGVVIPETIRRAMERNDYAAVSATFAAVNDLAVAVFFLNDAVKPEALALVAEIKHAGVQVELLSGDRSPVVREVAETLGIERWRAEVSPEEKAEAVARRESEGRKVIMVGDGANDAAALARATVGVSVTQGSDLTTGQAEILLLDGGLQGLGAARKTSKKVVRLIRQNLFWAFIYNLCALPLAAGLVPGFSITPGIAAGAMALSSLTVVANSMRLR